MYSLKKVIGDFYPGRQKRSSICREINFTNPAFSSVFAGAKIYTRSPLVYRCRA
jgi:hypothetical protein